VRVYAGISRQYNVSLSVRVLMSSGVWVRGCVDGCECTPTADGGCTLNVIVCGVGAWVCE